jgi:hypothetical protein
VSFQAGFVSIDSLPRLYVPQPIPARISDDGRVATWNPGMTFAAQVLVRVRLADGGVEERRSMNSGRARVREGEAIESILAEEVL